MLKIIDTPLTNWEPLKGQWLRALKPNTQEAYEIAYRQFFDWAMIPPDQVDKDDARCFAKYLTEQGLAPRTVRAKLAALRSFYEHCRQVGEWPAQRLNPFDRLNVRRPKENSTKVLPSVLPPRVLADIFGAINLKSRQGARDFALLYVLAASDLRPNAILQLTWREARNLSSDCVKVLRWYLSVVGRLGQIKGEDYIFMALRPEVAVRLPHIDEPTYCPLSADQGNKILKKYARRIGYDERAVWLTMLRLCELPASLKVS